MILETDSTVLLTVVWSFPSHSFFFLSRILTSYLFKNFNIMNESCSYIATYDHIKREKINNKHFTKQFHPACYDFDKEIIQAFCKVTYHVLSR